MLIEFLSLHSLSPKKNSVLFFVTTVVALLILAGALSQRLPFLFLLIPGLIVSILFITDLLVKELPLIRMQPWLTSLGYLVLPFSLVLSYYGQANFGILVISSMILIWVSDSGAYFVGKSLGKRKLMPSVSPGKSWEGFWGAGMCTLIASYIIFSLSGTFNLQIWVGIGLAVWILGSVGDLVESKMKRRLNIKDSGSFLPGHGGFLDRFDGYVFCLPFILLIVHFSSKL